MNKSKIIKNPSIHIQYMYFKDYMKVLQDIVNYKAMYLLHFISFNNIFSTNVERIN